MQKEYLWHLEKLLKMGILAKAYQCISWYKINNSAGLCFSFQRCITAGLTIALMKQKIKTSKHVALFSLPTTWGKQIFRYCTKYLICVRSLKHNWPKSALCSLNKHLWEIFRMRPSCKKKKKKRTWKQIYKLLCLSHSSLLDVLFGIFHVQGLWR